MRYRCFSRSQPFLVLHAYERELPSPCVRVNLNWNYLRTIAPSKQEMRIYRGIIFRRTTTICAVTHIRVNICVHEKKKSWSTPTTITFYLHLAAHAHSTNTHIAQSYGRLLSLLLHTIDMEIRNALNLRRKKCALLFESLMSMHCTDLVVTSPSTQQLWLICSYWFLMWLDLFIPFVHSIRIYFISFCAFSRKLHLFCIWSRLRLCFLFKFKNMRCYFQISVDFVFEFTSKKKETPQKLVWKNLQNKQVSTIV